MLMECFTDTLAVKAKAKLVVSGLVLDQDMQPIANVVITEVDIYGQAVGSPVYSNQDGAFSIAVSSAQNQLLFDHVSYEYDTIAIADFYSYFQLYSNGSLLDDVNVLNNYKSSKWFLWTAIGLVAGASIYAYNQKKPKQVKL